MAGQAAIDLLDGGATVPFIARYRKEATGTLDDAQLRLLDERLGYLGNWIPAARRSSSPSTPRASSTTRCGGRSLPPTPRRGSKICICPTSRSAAPRRRSRAKRDWSRLADALLAHPEREPKEAAQAYVDAEKGVETPDAALEGARAILAERWAEDAGLIGELRETFWRQAHLTSEVREGKQDAGAKFADYFDFAEPLAKLPSHRILALFRGEKEEVLDLRFDENGGTDATGVFEGRIAIHAGVAARGRSGDAG